MRNFESLKNNLAVSGGTGVGGGNDQYDNHNILNYAEVETEVRLLREQLADEKLKREQNFYDFH